MPHPKQLDVFAVIRSTGERTTQLTQQLLNEQLTENQVAIIHEKPFRRALERTYEIGIEKNYRWTLAVDADVLPALYAIQQLIEYAEQETDSLFQIKGQLWDKLFGGPRLVGMHLYQTCHLKQALECIDRSDQVHRPEFHVIESMNRMGFHEVRKQAILGLHDFEQYYFDYYRKGFVHAQKHGDAISLLHNYWTRMATVDDDFKCALAGFNDGIEQGGIAKTDVRYFEDRARDFLNSFRLKEKPELEIEMTAEQISDLISHMRVSREFKAWNRSLSFQKMKSRILCAIVPWIPQVFRKTIKSCLGMKTSRS